MVRDKVLSAGQRGVPLSILFEVLAAELEGGHIGTSLGCLG